MTRTTTDGLRLPRFPTSKFSVPTVPTGLVRRPRLLDKLDAGRRARLSLVVASAGAGKTVVLADWVMGRPERPTAWVHCDEADADPVRFLAAIVEAARRGFGRPDLGEDALQLLSIDGDASADVVAALADEIEDVGGDLLLIIDDLHLTGATGSRVLSLLVQYRPLCLQVAVATRTDPLLRLHRMRASQELLELRDDSLAFSREESAAFFSAFGVHLSAADLAFVQRRSEGWVVGLQMAALSVQSSPDARHAAGRVELHRHTMAGYFLDEVLYRQSTEVAEFMLDTSVLEELSVPSCTALCGPPAAVLLQRVYNGHLFVTALDEKTGTYRYHPLIRDVLQAELHRRNPGRERELNQAAARHSAEAGRAARAVRHLLAAGDPAGAFQLLNEMVIEDFARNPSRASSLDLDEVQPDVFTGRPEILIPLALDLGLRGAFDRGAQALALADRAEVDSERFPALAVRQAFLRALYAEMVGRLDESLSHVARARQLAVSVEKDEFLVTGLDAVEMYDRTYLFEFAEARRLSEAIINAPISPPPLRDVLCPGVMSQAAYLDGALGEAGALADSALASASGLGIGDEYFAFDARRTTALLALEQRDLARAARLTEEILAHQAVGRPAFDYLAQIDRARIWAAGGQIDEALSSLPAARAALKSDYSPLLAEADELEARFRLALGDYAGAMRLAGRLPDHRGNIAVAMIALAVDDPRTAANALARAPGTGPTIRSDLELSLIRAATALAEPSNRSGHLTREALDLAHTHGFFQTVLEVAPSVVDELIAGSANFPDAAYVSELVAARLEARKRSTPRPHHRAQVDTLSDAELRVLEKLPQRLTYADIGSELHLSLNTVKTHLRHTYMKLGVDSRSAAITRAISLGLI